MLAADKDILLSNKDNHAAIHKNMILPNNAALISNKEAFLQHKRECVCKARECILQIRLSFHQTKGTLL